MSNYGPNKLTDLDRKEILARKGTISGKKLAKEYNVSDTIIYRIWNNGKQTRKQTSEVCKPSNQKSKSRPKKLELIFATFKEYRDYIISNSVKTANNCLNMDGIIMRESDIKNDYLKNLRMFNEGILIKKV